jgi:hypothetical protein
MTFDMTTTLRLEYDAATQTLYIRLPQARWEEMRRILPAGLTKEPSMLSCMGGRDMSIRGFIKDLQQPGFVPVPPDDDSGAFAYLPVYRYEEEG